MVYETEGEEKRTHHGTSTAVWNGTTIQTTYRHPQANRTGAIEMIAFTKVALPFGELGNMSPHRITYEGKR